MADISGSKEPERARPLKKLIFDDLPTELSNLEYQMDSLFSHLAPYMESALAKPEEAPCSPPIGSSARDVTQNSVRRVNSLNGRILEMLNRLEL
jgi:hypothetical protein